MAQIELLAENIVHEVEQQDGVLKVRIYAPNSIVISSASNGAPLKQIDLQLKVKGLYSYAQVALSPEVGNKGVILLTPTITDNYESLKITLANISTEPFSLDKGKLLVTLLVC